MRVVHEEIDIMLTSYHTLASDFKNYELAITEPDVAKKRIAPHIFEIDFHRIVLDEAHIIRSSKTGLFKSVTSLSSKRKLCLSGTPFVNRPSDIHSLLLFLDVKPLSDKAVFDRLVNTPILHRREIGLATIRTTMAHVALRRKKSETHDAIQLDPKEVCLAKVTFPDGDHKRIYETLYGAARLCFVDLLYKDGISGIYDHYMELLALVLRIRQSCNHYDLVPADYRQKMEKAGEKIKRLVNLEEGEGETLLAALHDALNDIEMKECSVCFEMMDSDNAVALRRCKHVFCQPCLDRVPNSLCPLCRRAYAPEDMVDAIRAQQATSNAPKFVRITRSPKIQALLNLINEMKPDEKGVIFSQWTSMLDIVQAEFMALGHTFTRLDGSMNAQERIDAIEAFDTNGTSSMRTPRFILCSLHACGTGKFSGYDFR